jgi:DNA helicase-2/ATP-dependent DNA helicase PcrA
MSALRQMKSHVVEGISFTQMEASTRMTADELLAALASTTGRSPNREQRDVMKYNGGPLWVIAGPGTGKTYALVLRCLRLLCVDRVPPEAIVLTTFTRKAAEELQQRLHEALLRLAVSFPEVGAIDISQMRLGTLHSLCWDFLAETPASPFRHLQPLDALDRAFFVYTQSRFCKNDQEPESEQLFLQLLSWVDDKSYRALPSRWRRAQKFIEMYERVVDDQVARTRFAASGPAFRLLVQLIDEYEAALRQHHFTDQTLMQQQALEILHAPQGQKLVQGIQHVIVDEYQDTNPLQAAIYRALAATAPHHLCVVGDDDQALYRFRGGTVGCMVRFEHECKYAWSGVRVERVALTENYRSHPAIVDWINDYITAHPQMRQPNARVADKAPLRAQPSSHPTAPVVFAIRGKNAQEVASNFIDILLTLRGREVIETYAQCALLGFSLKPKKDTTIYINAFQEQGIAVARFSSPKYHPVYQHILGTLLMALDRSGNLIPPTFAAHDPVLGLYIEECRLLVQADPVLASIARKINTWLLTDKDAARRMSITTLAQLVLNARPCIEMIEQDKAAELAAQSLIQTLDSYDRIVQHGYSIPLEEVQGKQRVAKWWMERIYRVLVEGIHQEQFTRDEGTSIPFPSDAMPVLTIHSAKGLEFPIVAVVVDSSKSARPRATHRMEQDVLPFRQDLTGAEDPTIILGGDEETRAVQDIVRLHYVAYSRAQQVLMLLIPDGHVKSPPAIGLGTDTSWLQAQVEIWPPLQKRARKAKRGALVTTGGGGAA